METKKGLRFERDLVGKRRVKKKCVKFLSPLV